MKKSESGRRGQGQQTWEKARVAGKGRVKRMTRDVGVRYKSIDMAGNAFQLISLSTFTVHQDSRLKSSGGVNVLKTEIGGSLFTPATGYINYNL